MFRRQNGALVAIGELLAQLLDGDHRVPVERNYPPQRLILCVRDLRDTALSGLDRICRLGITFRGSGSGIMRDEAWVLSGLAYSVQQLMEMRDGGMGWGQIAAGLGLNLGSMVSAVKSESRVAEGQTKADGRVAVIHAQGAHAGAGGEVGAHAGLDARHQGLGAGAGATAGVGVKIGH